MIIIQALLIAIAANLASGRVWSPITWPFCYPLINGTVVGLTSELRLPGCQPCYDRDPAES